MSAPKSFASRRPWLLPLASLLALFVPSSAPAQETAVFDLAKLGQGGLALQGPATGRGAIGGDATVLADFNGDGFSDIALRYVQHQEPFGMGAAIVYGRSPGFGRYTLGADVPGATMLELRQPEQAGALLSDISGVGDLDGDGRSDLAIFVRRFKSVAVDSQERVFILNGFSESLPLVRLDDIGIGVRGTVVLSTDATHMYPTTSRNVGDFNGDGSADLAIAASASTNLHGEELAGIVFVLFNAALLPGVVDLAEVGKTVPGFRIHGTTRDVNEPTINYKHIGVLGSFFEPIGDFNGDGLADFSVGSSELVPLRGYIVLGQINPPANVDLYEAETNDKLIVFHGSWPVPAGDLNGDGQADLFLSWTGGRAFPGQPTPRGATYFYYGSGDFPKYIDIPNGDMERFASLTLLHPVNADLFECKSSGHDLNLDGQPDLLFGAPDASVRGMIRAGEAYAVYWDSKWSNGGDLGAGFAGIRMQGEHAYNSLGLQVLPAGDFNGDGAPDILANAPQHNSPAEADVGTAYVVFGQGSGPFPLTVQGLRPQQGSVRGGTEVLIEGSGFESTPVVHFGAQPAASVSVLSGSTLRAVTPPAADVGTVDVSVSLGGVTRRLGGAFDYTPSFPAVDLRELGSKGLVLEGLSARERTFGYPGIAPFAFLDLTGDGVDDLAAASTHRDGWEVTVVHGGGGLPDTVRAFEPSELVTSLSSSEVRSSQGATVAALGGINGSGRKHLAIGASDGVGYILLNAGSLPAEPLDIDAEVAGGRAVRVQLSGPFQPGYHLAFAPLGDLDGDGFEELAIGFPGAPLEPQDGLGPGDRAGAIFVVAGRQDWPARLDPSDPGARVARIHGRGAGHRFAERLETLGDFNGDGSLDLAADSLASPARTSAHVILGLEDLPPSANIEALLEAGLAMEVVLADGFRSFDWFHISGPGDVNGDGLADLALGVEGGGGTLQGVTYLVFGRGSPQRALSVAENPSEPDDVVRIVGEGSMEFAGRLGPAGDFNRDGFADFLIGAPGSVNIALEAGNVFLVFGSASLSPRIDLARPGGQALKISGRNIYGGAGFAVGPFGDLNADGLADFVFCENAIQPGDLGRVYVVYNAYGGAAFVRGDANFDGRVDVSDAVFILGYLFLGGAVPACTDAADVDDAGDLNITDAVRLLAHLFLGEEAPPGPYPASGDDLTLDDLDCVGF